MMSDVTRRDGPARDLERGPPSPTTESNGKARQDRREEIGSIVHFAQPNDERARVEKTFDETAILAVEKEAKGHDGRRTQKDAQDRIQSAKDWYIYGIHHGFNHLLSIPLVICLALYAQNRPLDKIACAARELECGFEGNEDAYGLGIRLGVYLQWATSPLVSFFLPSEERSLVASMAVFSIALLIAILVLSFNAACTYSVEIIVMIFIMITTEIMFVFGKVSLNALFQTIEKDEEDNWDVYRTRRGGSGGLNRVNSFMSATGPSAGRKLEGIYGWNLGGILLDTISAAYSCWFWIWMAIGKENPFEETPCGTSVFFLARTQGLGIRVVSGFTALFHIYYATLYVTKWLAEKILPKKYAVPVRDTLFFPVTVPMYLVIIIVSLPIAVYANFFFDEDPDDPYHEQIVIDITMGIFSVAIPIVSITGIELSLYWNNVQGVYSVSSTGQLIPLCAGMVSLLPLLWKIMRRKITHEQVSDEKFITQEPTQRKDWAGDSQGSTSSHVVGKGGVAEIVRKRRKSV